MTWGLHLKKSFGMKKRFKKWQRWVNGWGQGKSNETFLDNQVTN